MIQGPHLSPNEAHLVHYAFEWFGILVGVQYYRVLKAKAGQGAIYAPGNFAIVVGCFLGAAIGNKLVAFLENLQLLNEAGLSLGLLFAGQSIVGGLLGGLIGVELAKKIIKQPASTGDLFVPPLLLGLMIGRIGCFLAGLEDGTFGLPTQLAWAIDFGDGIGRHPTQLYEILFAGSFWFLLTRVRQKLASAPGLMFKIFLSVYLLWRFWVDGLKPVPYACPLGWSGIQWVCLIGLACYLPFVFKQWRDWSQQPIASLQGVRP